MKPTNVTIKLAVTLALSSLPVFASFAASQPEDIQQLLVQGHYWVGQGHPDLAIAAWKKVLLTDPDNKEANNALRELQAFHPSLIDRTKLELARKLARQHKYSDALKMYKLAFSGGTPNSFYAAEYYETLSGTRGGWKPAVEALGELVRKYPSNPHYRLVHARVQTYAETTRRQGIDTLEQMATDEKLAPEIRDAATKAWRNALLWLPGIGSDRKRYERYLALHPDDSKIENRLANLDKLGKHGSLQQGFDYLESGALEKAEATFSRLLKASPDNADVQAGLGITLMKRQRFSSAAEHLQKALSIAPEAHRDLEPLLQEAQFWASYKAAEQAYKRGHYHTALTRLRRAEQILPGRFESLLLHANIEAKRGNLQAASRLYDQALERQPDNRGARRGLLQLLIQSGDEQAAMALLKKHHLPEREFRRARNQLQAEQLRQQARLEDDPRAAIIDLRRALELDPGNAWLRLDLARVLASQGQIDAAIDLFDGYLKSFPRDSEARYAAAILHNEIGHPDSALKLLAAIPAADKGEEQLQFEKQLKARLQLEKAKKLISNGDYRAATRIAESLRRLGDSPMLRLIHAELLARLGEEKDALWQARHAWQPIRNDIGASLQYATVLLLAHDYQALDELLTDLKHRPGLTPSDKTALSRLRLGLELELANNLRKSGDYNAAWQQLLPFLPEYADDSALRTLLASIYHDAGNNELALRLYQEEVAHHPHNTDAWNGAVGAAMARGNNELAMALLAQALEHNPDSPALLVQRAQLNYLRGYRQTAIADLNEALEQDTATPQQRTTAAYPRPVPDTTEPSVDEHDAWALEAQSLRKRIDAETATTLTIGTKIRKRDGSPGLDQLTETALPIEWRTALNADMRWGIRLTPTLINAGTPTVSTSQLLGSQATLPSPSTEDNDLKDDGTGVSLFYEGRQWDADLGLSGTGYLIDNVEGRVAWKQQDFNDQLIVGVERRAVQESLLSWAGLKDGLTGIEWGGVTRNALRLDHYLRQPGMAPATIHSSASYALLRGDHVSDNRQLRLEGAIHWSLLNSSERQAQLGLRVSYQHFDKNLRGFTLGHGGYFSPRHHLSLAIPASFSGRHGALQYGLSLTLGLQYFEEEDTPFFPVDNNLQQQLDGSGTAATLDGNSKSSFTASIRAGFEYRLNNDFGIGGLLTSNNDRDFNQAGVALYLRYYFDGSSAQPELEYWQKPGEFAGL